MTPLNNQQKQLLFDYCIGLTSEKETTEAEALISSNEQAAEINSKLRAALAPLDSLEPESCPDELVEGTICRLNNLARSSQLRLEQLLANEQARKVAGKKRLWRNLGQIAAAAAVIIVFASAYFAPLKFLRQKSWQQRCQAQLQRIAQGIDYYSSDHDGQLPAVATIPGAPWWKVGYPGKENYSNTRPIWLLVKGNYVNPADFVCPGKSRGRVIQFDLSHAKNYNDFPDRSYITYSLRIRCSGSGQRSLLGRRVLMADLNPLFEKLPQDYSHPFKLHLNKDLLTLNSINHSRRGQNILFCDGSVRFVKIRRIGISEDDIFTLQNTDIYQGVEVPSRETDAFLAP